MLSLDEEICLQQSAIKRQKLVGGDEVAALLASSALKDPASTGDGSHEGIEAKQRRASALLEQDDSGDSADDNTLDAEDRRQRR